MIVNITNAITTILSLINIDYTYRREIILMVDASLDGWGGVCGITGLRDWVVWECA